jgi:hypothetical protein
LQERIGTSWVAFRESTDAWLTIKRGYGRDAVETVFQETLDAKTSPAEGQIISLWDDAEAADGS